MSDKPYPGDDAIITAIYEYFRCSMFDAERWFASIKLPEHKHSAYHDAIAKLKEKDDE